MIQMIASVAGFTAAAVFGSTALRQVHVRQNASPKDMDIRDIELVDSHAGRVAAFGAGDPGCDQNGDGVCGAGDFFAWVAAFNAGCAWPAERITETSTGSESPPPAVSQKGVKR